MKYGILVLLLIASQLSYCQKTDKPEYKGDVYQAHTDSTDSVSPVPVVENKVFQVVEQMPEYPGGEEALMKLIQKNIHYPKYERKHNIQGRVVVGFTVNQDGSISDVVVKRSVSKGIDDEAIRVVKLMSNFKPGRQKGKDVRVAFVLPIYFKLSPQ